jgi:hypothetical protein
MLFSFSVVNGWAYCTPSFPFRQSKAPAGFEFVFARNIQYMPFSVETGGNSSSDCCAFFLQKMIGRAMIYLSQPTQEAALPVK